MLIFVTSLFQSIILRIPLINLNIDLTQLSRMPIDSLYNICPLFINASIVYFTVSTIVEFLKMNCLFYHENYNQVNSNQEYEIEHNINYYINRLDTSNPFLYSNKAIALIE